MSIGKHVQHLFFVLILLYVDDILLASSSKIEILKVKTALGNEFKMKDLGMAKKILGMQLTRDRSSKTVFISQEEYFAKVLKIFHMEECKAVKTPFASHFKLS